MLPFEWLAAVWFAAFLVAAPLTDASRGRRLSVMTACALLVVLIGWGAPQSSAAVRAWLPHGYLVLGYWLPGLLASAPEAPTRLESWLLRTDAALRPHLPGVPRLLVPVVELAYLLCYALVPAAFAVVWTRGNAADVNRFWIAVLASGYACYGSLPWLVSRPPRIAAALSDARTHVLGSANVFVLSRVSHQLNTFPSGHVAVSCAAAGTVVAVAVLPGLLVAAAAAAIAAGAAAGRYHYVIDVVLGAGIAVLALAAALLG